MRIAIIEWTVNIGNGPRTMTHAIVERTGQDLESAASRWAYMSLSEKAYENCTITVCNTDPASMEVIRG